MDKLTNRDKSLLLLLCVALILFLPYYFYTSKVIEKNGIKAAEVLVLEQKEKEINSKRALLAQVKATAQARGNESVAKMPSTSTMIKSYEVHYLFTELIHARGLAHQMLTVSEPVGMPQIIPNAVSLAAFDDSAIGLTAKNKLELDVPGTQEAKTMSVIITVKGNFDSIMLLCDDIHAHSPYITIDNVNIPNVDNQEETEASLALTIYLSGNAPKPVPTATAAAVPAAI